MSAGIINTIFKIINFNFCKKIIFILFLIFSCTLFCNQNYDLYDNYDFALIFWHGVNGSKLSNNEKYKYNWQENASNLKGHLDYENNIISEPFEIIFKNKPNEKELENKLISYLHKCKEEHMAPFIVFVPELNIEGYLASLNPDKTNPLTLHSELIIKSDISKAKMLIPMVLNVLKEFNYDIYGYAHSYGGEIANKGIENSVVKVKSLIYLNARCNIAEINNLVNKGLIERTFRITTKSDALTYPGKAAFGKGYFHIEHNNYSNNVINNIIKSHNLLLSEKDIDLLIEVNGKKMNAKLSDILRLGFFSTKPMNEKALKDVQFLKDLINNYKNGGVDMAVEPKGQKKDLKKIKEKILKEKPEANEPYWTIKKEKEGK